MTAAAGVFLLIILSVTLAKTVAVVDAVQHIGAVHRAAEIVHSIRLPASASARSQVDASTRSRPPLVRVASQLQVYGPARTDALKIR